MVKRLIVLGKTVELPREMNDEDAKTNLVSLLQDLDSNLANELVSQEYATRVEGEDLVAYRIGATMG